MYRAKILLLASGLFLCSDVLRPAHAIFPNQPSKESLTVDTYFGGTPLQEWVQYLGTGESGTVDGLTVSLQFENVVSNSALQVSLAEFSSEAAARVGYQFAAADVVRRVKIPPAGLSSTLADYFWNFVEEGEVGPPGHPVQRGVLELKPDKYYSISWVCSGDHSGCKIAGSTNPNAYRDANHALQHRFVSPFDLREDGEVKDAFFILHPQDPIQSLGRGAANLAKQVVGAPYLGDGDTFGGKGWDIERNIYVSPDEIRNGYNYWNNALRHIDFGSGLDCSGLVQWSFNRFFDPLKSLMHNVIRWDNAAGQYTFNSETVAEEDLSPGDLLFFGTTTDDVTHVAMYVGDNGTFDVVHAADPRRGIITANKSDLKALGSFIGTTGLRRVVLSPAIGGSVKAGSPIDLIVTDPDGFTITPTTAIQTSEEYRREVPGELYYWESELGQDGRPEALVYWPTQKTGDYIIKTIPQSGVSPTSTYSLTFQSGNTTITLAQDMPISQIPIQGYGITTSAGEALSSFIPAAIDINPGSFPNYINLLSDRVVPVAILGSSTLDTHQIDPATVQLAGAPVALVRWRGISQPMASYSDVNEDGFTDLVVQVSAPDLQLTSSEGKANLEGSLLDGRRVKGSDEVQVVSPQE